MKSIIKRFKRKFLKADIWQGSAKYWDNRYKLGGDSGAGSYNRLAIFKADVLNKFISDNQIERVIEWGCGDGNQLTLANYPEYIGFDVSSEAVKICQRKFKNDKTKKFICNGKKDFIFNYEKADLSLSLDVLYHLVEDSVFDRYMRTLFDSSDRYVIIYSCNFDKDHEYSRAVTPQVRQAGNRLSGLTETAYASLLA